jgi:hypothetical protein
LFATQDFFLKIFISYYSHRVFFYKFFLKGFSFFYWIVFYSTFFRFASF